MLETFWKFVTLFCTSNSDNFSWCRFVSLSLSLSLSLIFSEMNRKEENSTVARKCRKSNKKRNTTRARVTFYGTRSFYITRKFPYESVKKTEQSALSKHVSIVFLPLFHENIHANLNEQIFSAHQHLHHHLKKKEFTPIDHANEVFRCSLPIVT